ncbi:MAG: hypothetical protein Q4A21_01045 [bacterium]|nr:hypothetical protein [bacterium]
MWKFSKSSATFSVLFSFLLVLFSSSTSFAHEVGSFKGLSEKERQSFARAFIQSEDHNPTVHYLIYNTKEYSQRNTLNVYAYSCDYLDYESYNPETGKYPIKSQPDCGSYLSYNKHTGRYTIKIKARYYTQSTYNKERGFLEGNGSFYANQPSAPSYEAEITSTDDPDYFVIYSDTNNKLNQFNIKPATSVPDSSNNSGNSSNNQDAGFFGGILQGIKDFFAPMFDSMSVFASWTGSFFENLKNGISSIFSGLFEGVAKIVDFIVNFFIELGKFIIDIVKKIFIPEQAELQAKFNSMSNQAKNSLGELTRYIEFNFFTGVSAQSSCRYDSQFAISSSSWDSFKQILKFDACSVPEPLIFLARNLLWFAFGFWAINRILQVIPILFGSYYVWERWAHKEDK